MDSKKVAIWVLSIALVLTITALVFVTIWYKNLKEKNANPEMVLQNYITTLPIYQNDTEAKANGLKSGDRYRKSASATDFEVVA